MKRWPYLMIIVGAALWGIIGVFVQGLYDLGFTAFQVLTIRAVSAAILLVSYVYFTNRDLLKIKPRDCTYFISMALFSVVFFNWCYFTAIGEVPMSVAAVLLYTAPAFVTILSRIFFKEAMTKRKIIALMTTFIGTTLVIGYLPQGAQGVSALGFWAGIGSGIGYGLYSIIGKVALDRYDTLTITTYTFVFASIFVFPFSGIWQNSVALTQTMTWIYILGLGSFPTAVAYILYTRGLSYVESSKASITATVEPVVATIVGIIIFGERLTYWQLLGIILVLMAIYIVQGKEKDIKEDVEENTYEEELIKKAEGVEKSQIQEDTGQ